MREAGFSSANPIGLGFLWCMWYVEYYHSAQSMYFDMSKFRLKDLLSWNVYLVLCTDESLHEVSGPSSVASRAKPTNAM